MLMFNMDIFAQISFQTTLRPVIFANHFRKDKVLICRCRWQDCKL